MFRFLSIFLFLIPTLSFAGLVKIPNGVELCSVLLDGHDLECKCDDGGVSSCSGEDFSENSEDFPKTEHRVILEFLKEGFELKGFSYRDEEAHFIFFRRKVLTGNLLDLEISSTKIRQPKKKHSSSRSVARTDSEK